MRWGLVWGVPRPAPLWIPAFAGMTRGGRRNDDAWGRPFDRLRANGRASSLWVAPCAGGLSALGFYQVVCYGFGAEVSLVGQVGLDGVYGCGDHVGADAFRFVGELRGSDEGVGVGADLVEGPR